MRPVQNQAKMRRVLEERALEAGFDLVGVARAEPLREGGERLREWQEAGMAADMGYMHRPVELLSDPKKLQKSARSVVSLGVSYYPGDHPENEGGGRVARYAWGLDYHEVIKGRLFRLREDLEEELGVRIRARGFTDAVPLLERSAAQHAGLGFFGRNSCLINNETGSYFFIADLIVDLDLDPDPPGKGTCGRCTRCMDRCPTGAIKAPGVVDARLCISYLTIENRGEIPRQLRPKVGLGLRLRRMPGGLSLQQDQGFEEPLARVLRRGRVGTLPGDREGPRDKNRRGVRGSLWRNPSHASWPGGPVAQLLRGRREPEIGEGCPCAGTGLAWGPFAAGAWARGVGAR